MSFNTAIAFVIALFVSAPAFAGGTIKGSISAKQAKHKKNAVVYIERTSKASYPAPAKGPDVDQINQEFIPFVTPVVKGTTIDFLNSDNTGHNIFTPDGEKWDAGVFNKGEKYKYTFSKEGVYTLLCKLHPSMIAYVIVLQNPHFAVTGEDGSYHIDNVPAGEYSLKLWHERKNADPQAVTVAEGATVTASFELRK